MLKGEEMKIEILSDEEILRIVQDGYENGNYDLDLGIDKAIAQEAKTYTIEQVVEWLEEPCPHKTNPPEFRSRQYCEICWQELKTEVKK